MSKEYETKVACFDLWKKKGNEQFRFKSFLARRNAWRVLGSSMGTPKLSSLTLAPL